jgi:predicted nucleotidyltransferase
MKQTLLHRNENAVMHEFAAGKENILRTLAYFDIFNYPLTKDEIHQFLLGQLSMRQLQKCLEQMVEDRIIFNQQEFYSLQNNLLLIHRRRMGNQRAEQLLTKAEKIGRFLYQFPFVRAVGVSGSLSKNFADENADIDFFIITKANRLWIARTLMHLYKKLTYLVGRQHYYCMNYYIDEEALPLKDKNIYTAIELKTLLPLNGQPAMQKLFDLNKWTNEWFPQCEYRQQLKKDPSNSLIKKIGEWIFNNSVGNWIDDRLQTITSRRWKKKEAKGKKNNSGRTVGLITDKHFAYSNSGSLREKVLAKYAKKLLELGIDN